MEIGIVGLPNTGKTTIFNILTKSKAETANYSFSTIKPNIGIVAVPDERLDFLHSIYKPKKDTPTYATIKFFDIAGLVQGASRGEGMGNQFLSNIKQADAIAHIVRVFKDENVPHVNKEINPINDIEIINTELIMSDMEIVNNNFEKIEKLAKQKDKNYEKKLTVFIKIKDSLERGILLNKLSLKQEELNELKEYNFLTVKPILYVLNVSDNEIKDFEEKNKNLIEYFKKSDYEYVIISAKIEMELMELSYQEIDEYIKELGFEYRGFDDFVKRSYKLLDLITFFTVGDDECRAWPVLRGVTASKAAGKIHSDLERGFIKAEVMSFEDFKKFGSENAVRDAGKLRLEGRDYIIQDGDIVYIKFNV